MIHKTYKTFLSYTLLCAMIIAQQLDAKSCETQCKTKCKVKCCANQSSINLDCLPKTTDYIIVGLGTAGATLARYLSDPIDGQYTNNVVVLEAGANHNQDPLVLQPYLLGTLPLGSSPEYSLTYIARTGNANFQFGYSGYTEGRMWGGGSGHNGMIAERGTPFLYSQWVTASGSTFWSYNNLLPIMKFLETYIPNGTVLDPLQRGTSGPMTISQDPYAPVSTNLFVNNYMVPVVGPLVTDYNTPAGTLGISSFQLNNTLGQTPNSHRTFSANSFLPTPLDNPTSPIISEEGMGLNGRKLQIVSNAYVARVIFDGQIAVGVEYILSDDPDQIITLFARKEVILCAGSVQDVGILQRSGIGPQAVLDPLGITSVVYNNNVGTALQNQYGSSCIMTATVGTGFPNVAPAGLFQYFTDGHPYFDGNVAGDGIRRIQSLFGAGPYFLHDLGIPLALIGPQVFIPGAFPTNSFGFVILAPRSRGSVAITSTNPLEIPLVDFGYWTDGTGPGSDYDAIIAAFKQVRDMAHAAGESMIFPTEAMFASDDQLRFAATNSTFVTYHAAGTCPMGTSIANGVVDSELRVFGVQNLRIADCSIEPVVSDGNTAIPAYYIGAALAKLMGNQTLP